mmetsp:Transcript_56476/g.150471  ORF Transcript_56476/g.150471 Transcript_56476/m.150471 type:complete len:789 (-) Transcript_56476:71-2437(-)
MWGSLLRPPVDTAQWRCPHGLGEVVFDCGFDSANLADVVVHRACESALAVQCWVRRDCQGTEFETQHSTWFLFRLRVEDTSLALTIQIPNLNNVTKLLQDGHKPMVCWEGGQWQPLPEAIEWCTRSSEDVDTRDSLCVQLSWTMNLTAGDSVAFAFSYPYSFYHLQQFLDCIDERKEQFESVGVLYHRSRLCFSADGLRVDMVKVAQGEGVELESPDVFAGRSVVLVSARVHPGETPSSFVCEAMMNFILSSSEVAEGLRRRHIFVFIPMLNPDGVFRGHYRTDGCGVDLNRTYTTCGPAQPTVAALKELCQTIHRFGRLHMYLDLHAHATRRGMFVFGNQPTTVDARVDGILFPYLLSTVVPEFELAGCEWAIRNMIRKTTKRSMADCSRVALFNATGGTCPLVFTVESNYSRGFRLVEQLGPKHWARLGRGLGEALYMFDNFDLPSLWLGKIFSTVRLSPSVFLISVVMRLSLRKPGSRIHHPPSPVSSGAPERSPQCDSNVICRTGRPQGWLVLPGLPGDQTSLGDVSPATTVSTNRRAFHGRGRSSQDCSGALQLEGTRLEISQAPRGQLSRWNTDIAPSRTLRIQPRQKTVSNVAVFPSIATPSLFSVYGASVFGTPASPPSSTLWGSVEVVGYASCDRQVFAQLRDGSWLLEKQLGERREVIDVCIFFRVLSSVTVREAADLRSPIVRSLPPGAECRVSELTVACGTLRAHIRGLGWVSEFWKKPSRGACASETLASGPPLLLRIAALSDAAVGEAVDGVYLLERNVSPLGDCEKSGSEDND